MTPEENNEKLEESVGTALELEVTSAALEPALKVEEEMMLAVEASHSAGLAGKDEGSSFHKTANTSLNKIVMNI